MKTPKETCITAFALFSLFFGAGNLILPPHLGLGSGKLWWLVALGFCFSAVLIPILGILAHARLQGTLFDIAKKVSPAFSLVYCYLIYAISITLPSSRTASVTHEIAIAPIFDTSSWFTSAIYFALVLLFVLNRSKILNLIGKFLTPGILLILLAIIVTAITGFEFSFGESQSSSPFTYGVLEGYQTFDGIGAVVVGGVIIVSINLRHKSLSYPAKKRMIAHAGWIAGCSLFFMYTGLILTGALMHSEFPLDISRTSLLNGVSRATLGSTAHLFLGVLVSLACFTTAVGIVTGTADFVKYRFGNSSKAYTFTAIIGCLLGVLMGHWKVDYIIAVAVPVLMFIYPITIVLILLNIVPEKFARPKVFQWVITTTVIFSIPDFLGSISPLGMFDWIPLGNYHMGWVLPALVVFILANFREKS